MSSSIIPILLLLTLTCCSDEPKAQHPASGASAPLPSSPPARETTQPQVVVPPAPDRKPSFDIKLQHLQEQVDWVNRRIGQ